jgi:hypothetical protein
MLEEMSGSGQGIFSLLTKLPSATADSDTQVGLGLIHKRNAQFPPISETKINFRKLPLGTNQMELKKIENGE